MSSSGLHAPDPEDRPSGSNLDEREKLKAHSYPSTYAGRDIDDIGADAGGETQAGIKKIEAISTAWTKWSLIIAYLS
jgi:hypothetical protein